MANSLSLYFSFFVLLLASTVRVTVSATTRATSTVAKDLVPCTMCAECENPCQPLPPPPPPVIECPPPPSPSPPPPSPPQPPAVVECPPPPKTSCPDNCEIPQGPPQPPYPPQSYFPPGTPYSYYVPDYGENSGRKIVPFQALLFSKPSAYTVYLAILQSLNYLTIFYLPYYLFI